MRAEVRILYADAALVVADKPAGLLSVPGRGPDKTDCLVARVGAIHPGALCVHRLDMATSGLMVLALTTQSHRALSEAFAARQVDKVYEAWVAGTPEPEAGSVDLPLIADWPNRPRQKVDWDVGKPSLTRYAVIARAGDRSRVRLEPVTGRSHQLRVHMAEIGHPILGDPFYAPPEIEALSPRLLLHARRLSFDHPDSGERLSFDSPPPF